MSSPLKIALLAAMASIAAFAEECGPDIRSRCTDTSWQKFQAALQQFTAIEPQVQAMSEDGQPVAAAPVFLAADDLRDFLKKTVNEIAEDHAMLATLQHAAKSFMESQAAQSAENSQPGA